MKEITTNSNNLIVVEVPEDAYDFWLKIFVDSSIGYYDKKGYQNFIPFKEAINCKILGKLSDISEEEYISEEECQRFVKLYNNNPQNPLYRDYNYDKPDGGQRVASYPKIREAKESFISLLQSQGVNTSKNLLIIEKL